MSGMHLIRGMTTTSTKKRKTKKSPGWAEAEAKHNAWLKKMGVHPSQLKGKDRCHGNTIPDYAENKPAIPTSDVIPTGSSKRERNIYTGTYIKGIGTMHKSNMVPITSGKDAKEIARMRRG